MKIVIGSRGSTLALHQSNWVIGRLKEENPGLECELKVIKTKGDLIQNVALDKIGDKGLFVKAIEDQLLSGDIDLAVHSMKDMPSKLPTGLKFSYAPIRVDNRDVMVLKEGYNSIDELPKGATIGSGSKRRKYQILKYRPDFNIVPIRGNIDTRIRKISEENLDGIILAAAGIERLDFKNRIKNSIEYINRDIILPAPAQGILALEIREDRQDINELIKSIRDEKTEIERDAERAFLDGVQGSCHIPVGAHCEVLDKKIMLQGLFGTEDGSILIKKSLEGTRDKAAELGYKLAAEITKEMKK
ncbi:MAG: hydroxymethylbilane synthase [Clostridium sp.]